jgi:hypothetical protein
MPNIQPLLGILHLHFFVFFYMQMGINPNVQQKCYKYGYHDMMQMKKLNPSFLLLKPQNKIKLNAQNNPSLGTCRIVARIIMVHSNSTFNSSMTTIVFYCFIWLVVVSLEQ